MIRLPIETTDRKQRGVLEWDSGQVRIEQGTLTDDTVQRVKATLAETHRSHSSDVIEEGDPEPEPDQFLQGPGATPDEFMFHANFLLVDAGCLVMYEEATGDPDELAQVFG